MTFFLRAKHWQVFIILYVVPFFLFVAGVLKTSFSTNDYTWDTLIFYPWIYGAVIPITILIACWLWTLSRLSESISDDLRMKPGLFNISILVYVIGQIVYYVLLAEGFLKDQSPDKKAGMLKYTSGDLFEPSAFLLLISAISLIYACYFVAKTIRTTELRRQVVFSDFAGEICMLLFWPIGVWIIQPRVNKGLRNG